MKQFESQVRFDAFNGLIYDASLKRIISSRLKEKKNFLSRDIEKHFTDILSMR